MEERPNYYSVIPANVRYDNTLRPNEKILYSEITALTQKNGECWASNKYFAELYEVKENAVATWIKHLKDKDYISIDYKYKNKSKEIEKRIIKIGGIQKDTRSYSKRYGGGIQKDEDNNTSINNKNINKYIYSRVIDYLNQKIGTAYKNTTKSTQSHIKARLDEGFTENDFIKVIDKKVKEWKGTKMEKFLRPETLFSTKFESYLNQKDKENWWNE